MARLILTVAPKTPGDPPNEVTIDLDDDTAFDRADFLRRLMRAWRAPIFSLRDATGAEICTVDLRRLTKVHIDATVTAPPAQL